MQKNVIQITFKISDPDRVNPRFYRVKTTWRLSMAAAQFFRSRTLTRLAYRCSSFSRICTRSKQSMSFKPSEPIAKWTPSEARYQFRTNPDLENVSSTSGYCMGYLQANLAILPSSLADEFEQFCELNKAACPLVYKSKRGELSAGILAEESDIRYSTLKT